MMLSILTTELEDDRNNGNASIWISLALFTNISKVFLNIKEHQNSRLSDNTIPNLIDVGLPSQ